MEITTMTFRDIIILVHALAAAAGLGTVLTTDYLFMKFLRDKRVSETNVRTMKHLSEVIWIALTVLIVSGIYLAATKAGILHSSKFLLKMVVVLTLTINGFVLNLFVTPKLSKIAFTKTGMLPDDHPDKIRKIAVFAGAISAFSWILAFILGKMKSIPLGVAEAIGFYLVILIVIGVVASLTKPKA